jgi:hypothetical protein
MHISKLAYLYNSNGSTQNKNTHENYILVRIKKTKEPTEHRILKNLLYNINLSYYRYKCKSIDCLLLKTKDNNIICETKITIN